MSGESMSALQLALLGQRARRDGLHHLAEPLAIVGMGCRVPGGVASPEEFWGLLRAGTITTRDVPEDRWAVEEWYDPDPSTPGRSSVKAGSFLDDIDRFDARFFGIPPREAERMDPHQRLALEVAWEALEDAGIRADRIRGRSVGVFTASYNDDFVLHHYLRPDTINERTITGVVHAVVANRISHFLGLHGPSISVDTACSSSLVALHLAARALREGSCDLALAGGVSLMLRAEPFISLSKAGFMSPDGRCKTFDAAADGFGRGEGCGFVVLRRLADALEQGDRVIAVVRGSAVNQDGPSTILAAPNGRAQAEVVRAALRDAGVAPGAVGYVEAHGTGTRLGDPIEVEALGEALGPVPEGSARWLASAKANIGHLEAAAGIVGVIRAALMLRHGWLPPHAGFETANPLLELDRHGFRIPVEGREWVSAGPRTAGVSSFGVGGTNAHVILEEAPRVPAPEARVTPAPWLLAISAHDEGALAELAVRHAQALETYGDDGEAFRRHCAATATRRSRLPARVAVVASSGGDAATLLRSSASGSGDEPAGVRRGRVDPGHEARPLFIFSGQGSQWTGMAVELIRDEPIAKAALDEIDALFRPLSGWSLAAAMQGEEAPWTLDDTAFAQPAIFAVQVMVARLLEAWGVKPSAVVGHSVGEIAAGYVSGHLDLERAVRMVHDRGRLMQEADSRGAMLAARLEVAEAQGVVAETGGAVQLAAMNAPGSVVFSGSSEAVEALSETLVSRGVRVKDLPVRYGFHSAMMSPIADRVRTSLADGAPGPRSGAELTCDLISTITGRVLGPGEFDAGHLAAGVDGPVRFEPAVAHALQRGATVVLEIGPRPVLTGDLLAIAETHGAEVAVLPTLGREDGGRRAMVEAAAALFCSGVEVGWSEVNGTAPADLPLPRHPWRRERYWLDAPERGGGSPATASGVTPLLGRRLDSPAIPHPIFETVLHESDPRVADHRIRDTVLLPAAMMLEMARQAGERVLGGPVEVFEAAFLHKVVLGPEPHLLHVAVSPGAEGEAARGVTLHAGDGAGRWSTAFEARVRPRPGHDEEVTSSDTAIPDPGQEVEVERLYRVAADAGAHFGAGYRRLVRLRAGSGSAIGELDLAGLPRDGGLPPALLDAALHPTLALLGEDAPVHLPVSVGAFSARGGGRPVRTRVREVEAPAGARAFDVRLLDEAEAEVARIDRLVLRPAPSDLTVLQRPEESLYRVEWREVELPPPGASRPTVVRVDADPGGYAEELAARLRASGMEVELAGTSTDREGPEAARVICTALGGASSPPVDGDAIASVTTRFAASLLELARSPADAPRPVVVLTRGAHPAVPGLHVDAPSGAALAGVVRALRREHPELAATALDLPPSPEPGEAEVIRGLLEGVTDEPVLALRSGHLLAPRLAEPRAAEAGGGGDRTRIVEFTQPGDLGSVRLTEVPRQAPTAGQVEVRVLRAALNFRDVLAGLGMVDARTTRALGHECAGVVTRVGPGVSNVRVGERVLALAEGGFGDHVVAPERRIFRLPKGMGWSDAVTLPIAALTARHGLVTLGGLERGHRVLIHSAAGGVGQAAVQLALSLGAEVYGTAGTAAKRDLLESMGVRGAFDSRSLAFREDVLEATGGAGVDLVLNSLAGEAVDAGLDLLVHGGAFVELGKRDLRDPAQVARDRRGVRYLAFDLFDEIDRDPDAHHAAWQRVLTSLEARDLSPLPRTVFPRDRIEEAFRFMSRAEHVGKIVLHLSDRRQPAVVRADGSYLVTGGTGGVGLATARWLVERGAGRVVVSSRTPPSGATAAVLDELRAGGADVRWIGADLQDREAVRTLVERSVEGGEPLRGVVHAAATLDDGLLADLDADRFAAPFGPKVTGAEHLASCLDPEPLDFLILCSAAGSLLDPAGQGNYAAANQALEALGRRLTDAGWPVTSVAWGLWDRGMAARDGGEAVRRWRALGLGAIDDETAPALLDAILAAGEPHVLAAILDRRALAREAGRLGPFLGDLDAGAAEDVGRRAGETAEELRALPPHRRDAGLHRHLAARLARVLGVVPDDINLESPFRDQGMDSLMAVELRNILARDLGIRLSATLAFDHPDIPAMAAHLADRLFGNDAAVQGAEGAADSTPVAPLDIEREIASLSDEEAERMLLEELEQLVVDDEGGVG